MYHGGTKQKSRGEVYIKSLEDYKGTKNFTLNNIKQVLEHLDNPQDKIKTIHIGGTNGKGSVSALIASIINSSGRKVGMTISPHLTYINERIVLEGMPINDDKLFIYAEEVSEVCHKLRINLSLHEAITAIAFQVFYKEKVDYAILEVGLGGKLDSTNVIKKPEVAVIVSISKDHSEILGDTEEQIAAQKAGIIKKNSEVVLGRVGGSVEKVIKEVADKYNARLRKLGNNFDIKYQAGLPFFTNHNHSFEIEPSLKGTHQLDNTAIAIEAAMLTGCLPEQCKKGIQTARWPGRIEEITCNDISIIMDCAHNPAGIESLVQYIKNQDITPSLVFGVLNTKEWKTMLSTILPHVQALNYISPDSVRSLNIQELESYLSGNGIRFKNYNDDYQKLSDDIKNKRLGDKVIIAGSMYMVGKLRGYFVDKLYGYPLWCAN